MRQRSPWSQPHLLRIGVLSFILLTTAGMLQSAGARQATPAASPTPGECDVAPRTVSEIQTLAESASGAGEETSVRPLPTGSPADVATVAAIGGVLHDMGACLTAGDMLRFYALHSDEWLRRFTAAIQELTTFTTSTPPLDDGQSADYLGPWHVRMLPDGRVMGAVLLRVGKELRPDPNRVRVLLFVHQNGDWLVDETIEMVALAECESPVEVAAVVGPPPGTALFDSWSVSCDEER